MQSSRSPPPYLDQLTVAIFGKTIQNKDIIGNLIIGHQVFDRITSNFAVSENDAFKIINTPNSFDEDVLYLDQQIIDFMALSYPGPHLFILAIDSENAQKEKVLAQVVKLQKMFGQEIIAHLVVILPDLESYISLLHLSNWFNIWSPGNHQLASECRRVCCGRHPFLFDYKNYSQEVVRKRIAALKKIRLNDQPLLYHEVRGAGAASSLESASVVSPAGVFETHPGRPPAEPNEKFNIVLLGLTGTGKSSSGNTILTALDRHVKPGQLFRSEPSSVPVTTRCEIITMQKPLRKPVRVIDTPDFFHSHLTDSQQQIEECKKYCRPGQCVVLLVFQLGRFTREDQGLLEKLENALGWRIRERTIILLTHGEDLKGDLGQFINANTELNKVVEACASRYHVFSNTSKKTKQVKELLQKISHFQNNSSASKPWFPPCFQS